MAFCLYHQKQNANQLVPQIFREEKGHWSQSNSVSREMQKMKFKEVKTMKVTVIEQENVVVTVYNPQSENQQELLEKACIDFIKSCQDK